MIIFWTLIFLLSPTLCFSETYWVHPDGSALWANCASATDPGENYCSYKSANLNVAPGDTVYLKGGTYIISGGNNYDQGIAPYASGTRDGSACTAAITYQAATGETPIFEAASLSNSHFGILLSGRECIRILGITFQEIKPYRGYLRSSSYNEIAYNTFTATTIPGTAAFGLSLNSSCAPNYNCWNTHNWIHHNTFEKAWNGAECGEGTDLLRIGDDDSMIEGADQTAANNYNTIEYNTFRWASHTPLDTYGNYGVVRNNHFHNEPWRDENDTNCIYKNVGFDNAAFDGKYGHRTFQISDGYERSRMYNLIEQNRSGFGSANPGNNGADGLVIAGPGNIVRYNDSFAAMNTCLIFKYGIGAGTGNGGSDNRVYNNSLFRCGYGFGAYYEYDQPGQSTSPEPLLAIRFLSSGGTGNKLVNNLIYNSRRYELSGFEISYGGTSEAVPPGTVLTNNWGTAAGDPVFINTNLTDPTSTTLPNLSLQSSSPAINGGTYLTLANGAGDNNATLHVDDALYFQDGTWGSSLSNIQADWIAIGTVTNVVQISSIDYETNTITLAEAKTWADDAPIWLYKKSDGEVVLYGSAPDYGAHEYDPGAAPQVTGSFGGNLR